MDRSLPPLPTNFVGVQHDIRESRPSLSFCFGGVDVSTEASRRARGRGADRPRLRFFQHTGEPIRCLNYPYERWRHTLAVVQQAALSQAVLRTHSSAGWNLLIGKNPLWVAKQHGHSVATAA